MTTTSEIKLIREAVKGRWPIKPITRVKVVNAVEQALDKPVMDEAGAKLQLLAARTLVQIDALNLKEDELKIKTLPKHHIHTNMSTDELKLAIQEKLASMNLTADNQTIQDGIKGLLERKNK